MNLPTPKLAPGLRATLLFVTLAVVASSGTNAASITYLGVEPGSAGSGYATQNWSNPGVAKTYDLSGDVYGTAGYYQIRPIAYPPGSTIYSGAAAGNDLGISAGSNPTLYSAPVMLSSITGGAGDYVNFTNYAIFRGPDGSALYTQGGLSVGVNQGPYNTPSGANNGYFGEAFTFTMGTSATYRVGVAVDTVASGTYAPNYVSIYNNGTGSVYSGSLTRDGTPDMTVFEINAAAGDSFTTALWQLSGTQSAAAFGLITFDVSSYNLDVASGTQTNSSALGGSPAALLKTGAGTTVLTGASTFTGATTISNGAVQLGGNGTLAGGSYGGAISLATNSSSLAIATTANQTLSGAISGSGSLAKSAAGTLTLSGNNTFGGGTLISEGTLQIGSGGTTGSVTGAITNNATLVLNRSDNLTQGGVISGTGVLTKSGSGTLVLDGANTYSGGTLVSAGALQIGSGGTTGSITGAITNNAALVFNRSDNLTQGGVISGSGVVTKSGSGTLVLDGANTYSGGTLVSAGTLQIGNGGTTGSVTGPITNNASLVYNLSNTNTNASTISGTGSLNQSGSGRTVLAASNSYSGTTLVSGGTLNILNDSALGATNGGTTVSNGILRVTATNSSGLALVGENVFLATGSTNAATFISERGAGVVGNVTNTYQGKITVGGNEARIDSLGGSGVHTLILSNAGNVIESTGNATLAFGGAGNVILRGAISVGSGSVNKVGGGTVFVENGGTLGGSSSALMLTNGNIDLGGLSLTNASFTIRAGVITNGTFAAATYNLEGGSVRANLGAGTVNVASGTTSVTNGGTLGAETINVTGGTLNLGSSGRLATNAVVTVNSGVITLGGNETIGSLAGSGGTVALGANTLTAGGADASTSFGGTLTGTGAIAKTGSGTMTLTGSSSYSGGTLISAGTLELGAGGAIAGSIANDASLRIRSDLTNIVSGTGSLTKTTGATASLWSANTYTGATVVEAGQLRLDGAGEISSSSTVQVASGASFSATGIFKTSNNLTIAGLSGAGNVYNAAGTLTVNKASGSDTLSGVISGGTGLTKSGSGTWTLSGANTYTGATAVGAGGLVVNGSISSATTVQSGASLGGSGSVASVTVQSGGTIAPGNSPGTLTITNGLTWVGGGNYNWQIFGVSGTAGATNTWDLISVTGGTWDINGLSSTNKFNINLWSLSGLPDTTGALAGFNSTQNYSWMILASGGLSGTFNTNLFNINTSAVNGTGGFVGATGLFSLAVDGNNDLFLNYTGAGAAVPEPGTWAAGGLLLLLAAFARRRAKARAEKAA